MQAQLHHTSRRLPLGQHRPNSRPEALIPRAAVPQQMVAPLTQTQSGLELETYDHGQHYGSIVHICRDVYWGSDYVPRMLPEYHKQEDIFLMVVKDAEEVVGIVAGNLRADTVCIFGLRIDSATRGKGVGKYLLFNFCTAAVEHFRQRGHPVQGLMTTTTSWNTPACSLISRSLPGPWLKTDVWPGFTALGTYEREIGWPETQATRDNNMLDKIGARQALQDDHQAVALLSQWVPASSCEQVSQALTAIRTRHLQQHSQRSAQAGGSADCVTAFFDHMPLDWLPKFYEMVPAQCAWTQEHVDRQHVWVLYGPASEESAGDSSSAAQGVVVLTRSPEGRRWTAGIVAEGDSVIHSACLLVDQQQPHWIAFVDRGCIYEAPMPLEQAKQAEHLHPAPPAVYATTNGTGDMLVYAKSL